MRLGGAGVGHGGLAHGKHRGDVVRRLRDRDERLHAAGEDGLCR